MIRISKYISAYEALAKSFSKKSGVNLICKGGSFLTNGETIIIPEIPDELNASLRDPSLAGILHESQHVVHSSFDKKNVLNGFAGLQNNVEDIRIYKLGKKEYPGYQDLQETGLKFIRDNIIVPELLSGAPVDKLTFLGGCLQYRASGMDDSFFPEEIRELASIVEGELDVNWIPREKGHSQSKEITMRMVSLIRDKLEELKKDPPEEKPKDKEKQKDKEGEKSENTEENTEGEKSGSTEDTEEDIEETGDTEGKNSGSTEGDTGEDAGEGSSLGKQSDSSKKQLSVLRAPYIEDLLNQSETERDPQQQKGIMEMLEDLLTKFISSHTAKNNKHVPWEKMIVFDQEKTANERLKELSDWEINACKGKYSENKEKIDKQVRVLKAKLLPVLLAQKRSSFLLEQKEGIIDEARMFRIPNGDSSIYKKKVYGRKLNTTISILCDVSGSMRTRGKIEIVRPTVETICDSLNYLKVPFEILSFSTKEFRMNAEEERAVNEFRKLPISVRQIYNRAVPIIHTIIKSFNESYFNAREYIKFMIAEGGNVDGEGVEWALKRLSERREDRKILIVLSDGLPSSTTCDDHLLRKDLIEKVKKAEKVGIEVIGIGILTSAPQNFYPNFEIINDVNEIAVKIYSSLMNILKN